MQTAHRGNVGALPPVAAATLFVFYLVWAAMHDIAHGEADLTLEWVALAGAAPAFAVLYAIAVRYLPAKARRAWLWGVATLLVLFSAGAVSSYLHPKYPADPRLAALYLAAGIPALCAVGAALVRFRA